MNSRVRLRTVRVSLLIGSIACFGAADASAQAPPAPWLTANVGSPSPAGTSSFDGQALTLTVGGTRIGGGSDQFHFVYQQITGNVEVTARVDSIFYAAALSSGGVMIRSSLAANAVHGTALASAGNGLSFVRRIKTGGLTRTVAGEMAKPPRWLRVTRIGSTITASSSVDGTTWKTIGSAAIGVAATAYVGVVASSGIGGVSTAAVLSQVSVVPLSLPPPQQARDIGSSAVKGSEIYRLGTYTITASGAGIWSTSDQFRYVYQPLTGDVDIAARVASLTAANPAAKVGLMVRESLAANSKHAMAGVTAGRHFVFDRRLETGGVTQRSDDGTTTAPGWIRLTRVGSQFEAFRSPDGVNWTSIGRDVVPMADVVYVGIAVTSASTKSSATAVVDNVSAALSAPRTTNQPPTVAITAPSTGAAFTAPATITIAASASDPENRLAKVEFFDGTHFIAAATAAPFSTTWSSVPSGTHVLTAVASDSDGGMTTSSPVSIVVNGNAPPTVSLTTPTAGASFVPPATIAMSANASDPENRMSRVEFYAGSTLVGTASAAPYSVVWSSVPEGTYALTAKALDSDGGSTTSAAVSVVVKANQPPTVSLTSPAAGASFAPPATITLSANASDPENRMSRVEFYANGTLVGTDSAAPYSVAWSSVPAGTYSLTAKAIDTDGGSTTSAAVSVTVKVNQPPTVILTAPAAGALFVQPTTVTIAATASDPENRMSRVEFYANSALVGSDSTAPYAIVWSPAAAGTYSVTARAFDADGNSTTSAGASVIVTANQPPTVSLTSPAAGASFLAPASITLLAAASDPDGQVSRVEFYAGSTLVGTASGIAPYSVTWPSVAAGSYVLKAVAYDAAGASASSALTTINVMSATAPRTIAFLASSDHDTLVINYVFDVFAAGADPNTAVPLASSDLAKPAPDGTGTITVDRATFFASLPPGTYVATVSAVGTGGRGRCAPSTFTR